MNNVILAFITGLTAGGISCLAVQGGLLTTVLTNKTDPEKKDWKIILSFLISKLIAYTFLGIILGLIGSVFNISPQLQGFIQLLVGIILLVSVARILNLHPIFRHFVIEPPKSIFRILREKSLDASYVSPIILGALTVLIPCGITQTMMILAISSQSALWGGLILFAFILGTSPVFFLLGLGITQLMKKEVFSYVTALLVLVMSIFSFRSAFNLLGVNLFNSQNSNSNASYAQLRNGKQYVEIEVLNSGYRSKTTTLKVNVPVVLKLVTNNVLSCSRAFTIPSLNISKVLSPTGEETIEFTPTRTGTLIYTCSMGMYRGSFEVTE